MPFVDLVSSEDYAAIWYTTNAPACNVSGFDPAKPTLVMLHPLFLDSSWMHPQLDDPRLNANFNIIVFDLRTSGKSLYRPSGRYDLLKSIFDAFEELCHLWCYAEDLESFETACRELLNCYAMDTHPDLIDEVRVPFALLRDAHRADHAFDVQLVAFWEVHYPPFRRTFALTNVNLVLNRTPMSPEQLAGVRCPVLIIQAERSPTHPMEYAHQLRQALINVPNGAQLFNVKATHGYLSILSSSIVNQVLNKFLTRQPHARSDLREPEIPLAERMRAALAQLAEWEDDPAIADQDPLSPLSFSCVTEEVRKSQDELYTIYLEGMHAAFSPLAPDGRPLRKFSERKDEHWLNSSSDGYSYTSTYPFLPSPSPPPHPLADPDIKQFQDRISEGNRDKRRPGKRPTTSNGNGTSHGNGGGGGENGRLPGSVPESSLLFAHSEPVTQELQQVARIRRATVIPPGTADKHVIKGSMAKVIASGASTSLPRRLLR
ncbi:hypothetical protein TRAPUB_10274 [Trametes pubescens]|uniref:Alpha/beta-hydrolase n=1 Tax=Trametes pubescens TaxID=154538 RepID=A0A1M2W060_TRAPU|nr:hypothetical protein TRAPUB_10274 [Trametes pubescens]